MAYVKIIFQNSPSTATPLNAQNLNHMDDQIAENDRRLNELETAGVVNTFNGRTGNVVPEKGDYDINQINATDGQNGYVPVWRNSGTEESPDWGFNMEPQSGSGTGGHTIVDQGGNDMASEDAMQFLDAFVSDDSTNGRTVVENIKEHTTASDYEQATEDGFHVIDDGNDVPIGEIDEDVVSVTADGVKTWATLLNELWSKIDSSKVTDNALFVYDTGTNRVIYSLYLKTNNTYAFHLTRTGSSNISNGTVDIRQSNSRMFEGTVSTSATTITNISSDVPANGTVITLYYGTSSTVINLKTSANYCMMSDGVTSVESALSYSTTEHVVGKWIDGLTLYEKTIDFGRMPNMTTKSVAHGISNLRFVYEIRGVTILESGNPHTTIPLPNVVAESANFSYQSQISVDPTNVNIVTSRDRSEWNAYVTLRYTKTS